MPTCSQCGAEYGAEVPSRTGYCPACEQGLELPAEDAGPAPAEPVWSHAAAMPVTLALIALNVLVFAAMLLKGVSPTRPTVEQLWRWGADFGPLTFDGQWWRILTNIFLHIGVLHLLVNMWALWNLGALAERLYGRWLFLYMYLLSGAAGSIASLGWHPNVTGAGASGAIFGLAGALIVTFRWGKLPIPRSVLRPILSTLVIFTVANVLFDLWIKFADNAAHLGGLAAGLLLGAIVIQPALRRPGSGRARLATAVALVLLTVAAWAAASRAGRWVVHLRRGEQAMQQSKPDAAVSELRQVVALRPNDARFQVLLARAYIQGQHLPEAKARLLRAVELQPHDPEPLSDLGNLYLMMQQPQQAYDTFTRLVEVAPNSPAAYVQLAYGALVNSRPAEAIAAYQRAIALKPDFTAALYNLGVTYMRVREYDNALASFQQLARQSPNSAEAQFGIAAAYKAKGMDAEAEAAHQKAVSLTPNPGVRTPKR